MNRQACLNLAVVSYLANVDWIEGDCALRVWDAALLSSAIFVCSTHAVYAEPSSLSDLTLNAAPAIALESGIDSGRVAGLF